MGKLAQSTTKYTIDTVIEADGIVEKPDVIGAIFGQTEGLLGADLDLRELQRTGRIGRIEVNMVSNRGKSSGTILIPSSLDASETALIAAALETIERVGPCVAQIKVHNVEDVRISKRKYVIDRAKEILKQLVDASVPDSNVLSEQIKEDVRTLEIKEYQGVPCGPDVSTSESIVLVEGRADVLNLLRNGIKNAIAVGGTSISPAIANLTKEKETTVFLDGDRGGELILKELRQLIDIDFVVFAPEGKEVEELTKKEIYKALRERTSVEQLIKEERIADLPGYEKRLPRQERNRYEAEERPQQEQDEKRHEKSLKISRSELNRFRDILGELIGTRAACILDERMELLGKVPVRELHNSLQAIRAHAVVFDGKVDQDMVNAAEQTGVKYLVGMDKERTNKSPVITLSRKNLETSK